VALCSSENQALNFQQLFEPLSKIPRPVWTTVVTIIYTVAAIAGRQHLLSIFLNFLALIGYWVIIWIAIVLEDEFIFRKKRYNWDDWKDQSKLPVGAAAFASFLIGWAGAILCMGQTYFYGPIAKLVGDYGADVSYSVARSLCVLANTPHRLDCLLPLLGQPSAICLFGTWSSSFFVAEEFR
jgi:purine-cytosine permease-like protein